MFRCVVFDMDGTLLDTLHDLANAGNYTLSALGLPTHPVDAYRQMVGNGIPKLLQRMLGEPHGQPATFELAQKLFNKYYDAHSLERTMPYAGISELLHTLKEAGILLAVVSNKADCYAGPIAEHFFPGLFDAVAGLRDGFLPKPDAATTLSLLEQLGMPPSSALFCGDTNVDIQTAQNAGMKSCGVLWGFRSRQELEQASADYLAADAAALEKLILG